MAIQVRFCSINWLFLNCAILHNNRAQSLPPGWDLGRGPPKWLHVVLRFLCPGSSCPEYHQHVCGTVQRKSKEAAMLYYSPKGVKRNHKARALIGTIGRTTCTPPTPCPHPLMIMTLGHYNKHWFRFLHVGGWSISSLSFCVCVCVCVCVCSVYVCVCDFKK